jgi:hypothetical protein
VIGQKAFMFYLLTVLLVFFAVSIGLIGSLSLWRNVWRGDQMRFGERIDLEFRPVAPTQSANSLFKSLDVIAREVGNSQGSKPGFHQRLDRIIMQAGLSFSIHDLILYSVTMAIVIGVAWQWEFGNITYGLH